MNDTYPLPLAGIRILDATSVIMGPYATQMLSEFGAEVIKLEPPEGDIMRDMGPFREPGRGPVFLNLNRGKRSICLDLKAAETREAIHSAIRSSHVFVSNMRRKALEKLGLGWETLCQYNPDLLYVFLSGFAEQGPNAGRPAYDDLIQGMTALPDLVARANGCPQQYLPINLADKVMGLFAAQTVLAALFQQAAHKTGGQYIEVPMFETVASFVLTDHLGAETFEPSSGSPGNRRLLSPYRRPYKTMDGWLSTIVYTNKHWETFLRLVGAEELWKRDARFHSMASRTQNIDYVYGFVSEHIARRTTDEWVKTLNAADIPAAPSASLEDLIRALEKPENGVIRKYQDNHGAWYRGLEPTIRWSRTRIRARGVAPRLGEHTGEVLHEWGIRQTEAMPTD